MPIEWESAQSQTPMQDRMKREGQFRAEWGYYQGRAVSGGVQEQLVILPPDATRSEGLLITDRAGFKSPMIPAGMPLWAFAAMTAGAASFYPLILSGAAGGATLLVPLLIGVLGALVWVLAGRWWMRDTWQRTVILDYVTGHDEAIPETEQGWQETMEEHPRLRAFRDLFAELEQLHAVIRERNAASRQDRQRLQEAVDGVWSTVYINAVTAAQRW